MRRALTCLCLLLAAPLVAQSPDDYWSFPAAQRVTWGNLEVKNPQEPIDPATLTPVVTVGCDIRGVAEIVEAAREMKPYLLPREVPLQVAPGVRSVTEGLVYVWSTKAQRLRAQADEVEAEQEAHDRLRAAIKACEVSE